jgi:hypothetical protein
MGVQDMPTHMPTQEEQSESSAFGEDDNLSTIRTGESGSGAGAKGLSDTAVETARVMAGTVANQAKSLATNVAQEFGASAEVGVGKGADAIDGVARAIRTAANELDQTSPAIAQSVRSAAGQLEAFTNNIRGKSVGDLMNAAKDLARSQPTYFVAGAVIAGIAISRFIKSSKPTPASTAPANSMPPQTQFGDTRRWE